MGIHPSIAFLRSQEQNTPKYPQNDNTESLREVGVEEPINGILKTSAGWLDFADIEHSNDFQFFFFHLDLFIKLTNEASLKLLHSF